MYENNQSGLSDKGFALVEILVALAIIALLVAAFAPLFSQTVANIFWAGKRTQELNTARGQMETRIASQTGYTSGNVSVVFPGGTASVPGGVINDIENFTTFLPYAPSMVLTPSQVKEGYSAADSHIAVVGSDTHFTASTVAKAIWADGTETTLTYAYTDATHASVTLPIDNGLLNQNGPYVIRLTSGTEVVRAVFDVKLPMAVAAGASGTITVTGSGDHWETRTSPTSNQINGIDGYDEGFIAVGEDGTVLKLAEGHAWDTITSGTDSDLNNILFVGPTALAVGDGGTAIQSTDLSTFTAVSGIPTAITNYDLKGMATDDEVLVVTGKDNRSGDQYKNDGVILSVNADGNATLYPRDEQPINDVCWSNDKFVAIGNGGTVLVSSDGTTWPAVFSPDDLRDPSNSTVHSLKVWLKADAITGVASGNALTGGWADSSIYGNNASASMGGPTYQTGVVNDKPVVRFKSGDRLNLPTTPAATNNFTVFVVAKTTASHENDTEDAATGGTSGQKYIFGADVGTSSTANMGLSMGNNGVSVYERRTNSPTRYPAVIVHPFSPTVNTFSLIEVSYSNRASALWYNGTSSTADTHSATSGVTTLNCPTKIGNGDTQTFDGDIAEILIYNRVLTDTERMNVERYLASKYKLYNNFNAVCASSTRYVAVGNGGVIATSDNTALWTVRTSGTTKDLYDVVWTGDKFVAVGKEGLALYSTNGETWSTVSSATSHDLFAVGS